MAEILRPVKVLGVGLLGALGASTLTGALMEHKPTESEQIAVLRDCEAQLSETGSVEDVLPESCEDYAYQLSTGNDGEAPFVIPPRAELAEAVDIMDNQESQNALVKAQLFMAAVGGVMLGGLTAMSTRNIYGRRKTSGLGARGTAAVVFGIGAFVGGGFAANSDPNVFERDDLIHKQGVEAESIPVTSAADALATGLATGLAAGGSAGVLLSLRGNTTRKQNSIVKN